ncbi:alpha/beta-hydrolase [Calocera viscosa TUFC12733]|uniref:Alpha/beta-hydrolase n=1 Tax=Calocera viscosa (strain TUFC12733) TaxID=1330018 RepID=A0A167H927_CALVF|nr:alpha/beta-hydrolase [Calocera viscosa TUFC12733]
MFKLAKRSYPITAKLLTSSDGTKIYAEATGDPSKPSIIFVPGFALSAVVFDGLFHNERLLEKYYLVLYEPRGHARSGQPEAEEAYASQRYADDFLAVVRGFNLHKPIWAGWSASGAISTDIITALGPDAVSAFVYISGVPTMVGSEAFRTDFLNSCVGGLLTPDAVGQAQAAMTFVNGCFEKPDAVPYLMRVAMVGSTFTQTPTARLRGLMRQQDPSALYRASAGGLPLLFVYGQKDGAVKTDVIGKVLRQHFKRLLVREIPGVGHTPFIEAPDAFVAHLIEFADQVC